MRIDTNDKQLRKHLDTECFLLEYTLWVNIHREDGTKLDDFIFDVNTDSDLDRETSDLEDAMDAALAHAETRMTEAEDGCYTIGIQLRFHVNQWSAWMIDLKEDIQCTVKDGEVL